MRICLAQTRSIKGAIEANLAKHLKFVKRAIAEKVDLIIFPELSLSNYEPALASNLACDPKTPIFNSLQQLSDQSGICIGAGMPVNTEDGVAIGMLLFQANKERKFYAKQMLHANELPYFCAGKTQTYLHIKQHKIALAICFEAVQQDHFLNACNGGAQLYIASVSKERSGMKHASKCFEKMARTQGIPVLVSNGIGQCDQFMSSGSSAAWNNKGEQLKKLSETDEGILIYDLKHEEVVSKTWGITPGKAADLDEVLCVYREARQALEEKGVFQWTDRYPTPQLIEADLKSGMLHLLRENGVVVGGIHLSSNQEKEYASVNWQFNSNKVLVIHRLVVSPRHQRKGFASEMMDFAEAFAQEENYTSIRLDAYSQNSGVLELYCKRDYYKRGEIRFPGRENVFHCLEKVVES